MSEVIGLRDGWRSEERSETEEIDLEGLLRSWPREYRGKLRLRRILQYQACLGTVGKPVLKYYKRRFSHEA